MISNEELFEDVNSRKAINESHVRKPRRISLNESLPYEKRGKFFTAISQAIKGVITDFGLTEEAIINPELAPTKEDIELALEFFKKNYLDEFYKESLTNRPGRTVNESLKKGGRKLNETLMDAVLDRIDGVPYNPREFYDYVNGWYDDIAHEMDDGEEIDVATAIIRGLKDSIRGDGGEPNSVNARQLYKFVKDSTWLTNGKTGETPDYLKQLSLSEDVRKEWKPNLTFKHIKDVLEKALSRGKYVNNEREEVLAAIELCDKKQKYTPEQRKFIRDSHEKMWRMNRNKSMNEDLEPEAIDEPEKAEITWVDDSGEQKVSTVELINKSFPETALKFSKEHNDCSIINCTAPLKGAQKEDEPKEVPLTEGYLEANGLADRSPNYLRHMLGRLKSDCEYVINQNASLDRLWFTNNSMAHCALMREIYHKLDDMGYNPEDIVSLEKIDEYDNILYDMSDYSSSMYESLNESEETDGLANLISNEINGEFETTNGYRNLRQVASEVAPDMLPVIDDIMDEENTHVGQLQTLLSMVDDSADNIDVGAEETEDQLEDEDVEIGHNDEVDVDFADIKKSDDEDADLEVKDDFDFDDEPFDEE